MECLAEMQALLNKPLTHRVAPRASQVEELMKKSVITENFHTLRVLPNEARAQFSKKKAPPPELPDEVKKDLEIIKMRTVLDPKHFYKQDKTIGTSTNIQVGRVVDSPADFYHSRLTKKERKQTLVDELLADAEFQRYNKANFARIIKETKPFNKKPYRKANRLKRKKKKH